MERFLKFVRHICEIDRGELMVRALYNQIREALSSSLGRKEEGEDKKQYRRLIEEGMKEVNGLMNEGNNYIALLKLSDLEEYLPHVPEMKEKVYGLMVTARLEVASDYVESGKYLRALGHLIATETYIKYVDVEEGTEEKLRELYEDVRLGLLKKVNEMLFDILSGKKGIEKLKAYYESVCSILEKHEGRMRDELGAISRDIMNISKYLVNSRNNSNSEAKK